MEAYKELLEKNEAAVNRLASRVSRIELYIMIVIGILCKYYVMYVPGFTLGRMLVLILAPLLLPTLVVDVLHFEKPWVKYAVLTCSVVASGLCYAAFTFQLMLILLFPTVVAALYYNKRVMIVICAESVFSIFFSHILSHYIMFAQILEPFKGIRNIIQFAAMPRIFIYLCFAVVFWILSNRTSALMLNIYRVTQEKELLELQSSMTDKVARYEEREKISRDIHNSVGHTITAAIMAIDAAEAIRGVSAELADSKVSAAGERMRESLQVIRDSVRLVDSRDTSISLKDLIKTLTICLRQFEMDANMRIQNNFGEIPADILSMSINAEHARFPVRRRPGMPHQQRQARESEPRHPEHQLRPRPCGNGGNRQRQRAAVLRAGRRQRLRVEKNRLISEGQRRHDDLPERAGVLRDTLASH